LRDAEVESGKVAAASRPKPIAGSTKLSLRHTPEAIVVREAAERDYPGIARVQQKCPEAAQWPIGDYGGFAVLVAFVGNRIAGFCAWRQASADEAELLNLAVDPELRRHGIATALLDRLARVARGEIFLEVAETNLAARRLYERTGWSAAGMRTGYYPGGINAVVMKKRSWYSPE
jgi:ribosomal-protein-alanine N-acetyltransferase